MMVLLTPDGEDYQRDYFADSIEDCWNLCNDAGSRWFFYPIGFVTRYDSSVNNKRILRKNYNIHLYSLWI